MSQRTHEPAGNSALSFRLLVGSREAPLAMPLPLGRVVTVGSDPSCELRFAHPTLAARHAQIEARLDAIAVRDLEGSSGTWVAERKVGHPRLAYAGDRLRFGAVEALLVGVPLAEDAQRSKALASLLHPDIWSISVPRLAEIESAEFAEVLAAELRKAPWLAISLAAHGLLFLFAWLALALPERTVPEPPQPLRFSSSPIDEAHDGVDELVTEEQIEAEAPQESASEEPPSESSAEPPEEELLVEEPSSGGYDAPGVGRSPVGEFGEPRLGPGNRRGRGRDRGLEGLLGDEKLRGTLRSMRQNGLEVVMVFDSTGSMGGILDQAKQRMDEMISVLEILVPGVRVGLVTYRDRGKEEYTTRECPLTRSRYRLRDFIEGVSAGGGDDIPEAVLDGLDAAFRKMDWSSSAFRFVAVIGDAPPHERDRPKVKNIVRRFAREHGMTSMVSSIYTGGGFARDEEAIESFREIAAEGGGVFVELAQQERVLREIVALVFGRQFENGLADLYRHVEALQRLGDDERRWIQDLDISAMIERGLVPTRQRAIAPEVVDSLIGMGRSSVKRREVIETTIQLLHGSELSEETLWAARWILRRISDGEIDFDPNAPTSRRIQELKRLRPRALESGGR
ncbi:MAG: FHA domain-containing protein [Planctomycetes bacterium]|nr:FHA domain-containing protein [Planctomycetota bacterium]